MLLPVSATAAGITGSRLPGRKFPPDPAVLPLNFSYYLLRENRDLLLFFTFLPYYR